MNAAGIVIFGLAWFAFAYFWYGGVIRRKLLSHGKKKEMPSHEFQDGLDFVPTKPAILFGHHFSSIAGAGPIVGPIIAFSLFGWLPALIWVLAGSVFLGAVHDYTAMTVSVRNKGISIVEIAETTVSEQARTIFAVFVWLALILLEAVFANLTAATLNERPEIVIPTFGIIIIAVVFGFFVIRRNLNLLAGTVLALAALIALVYLGREITVYASQETWLIIVFVYAFIAAILPVWLLLQPNDYISMLILISGLLIGFAGILVLNPEINAPAFISFDSSTGPMFPMLFIIIACGAISGFHSLVASGTSAKQLDKEKDAQKVSYGSMLVEGIIALLVVLMISSVLNWHGTGALSFHNLMSKSPNIVFGTALGTTTASIGIPLAVGTAFGILMLNTFILTSLDTCTRLNRYIMQETLGTRIGGIFKNKYFAAASSLVLALILCLSNGYEVIWPMFGASNQLIASLALFVVTMYFVGFNAPKWYTLLPGIFMLIVTETAIFYQAFFTHLPQQNWLLFVISILLFILGLAVALESFKKLASVKSKNKPE